MVPFQSESMFPDEMNHITKTILFSFESFKNQLLKSGKRLSGPFSKPLYLYQKNFAEKLADEHSNMFCT